MEAQYSPGSNDSIYIDWTISLDSKELYFTGDHTVLVRAVDESNQHSISAHSEFYAYGEASESSSGENLVLLVVVGLLLVGMAVVVYRKNYLNQ